MTIGLHPEHFSAPAVQVPDHIPHAFIRHRDLHVHDGFENHRLGLLDGVFESHGTGDLEGHVGGVHVVVGAVVERHAHIHHRIAGQMTFHHCLPDPLLHRRDIIARNGAADNLIYKLKPFSARERLDFQPGIPVLPPSSRLLFVLALGAGRPFDGLFVGHLRGLKLYLGAVLSLELLDHHLDVELAHPGNDEFPCLQIAVHFYSWIFFHHAMQSLRDFLLVSLCLGFEGKGDQRGEVRQAFKLNGRLLFAERIPGCDLFELCGGDNLAGVGLPDRLLFFPLEPEELADLLLHLLVGIIDRHIRGDLPGNDLHDRKLSGKGINDRFKYIGCKRTTRIMDPFFQLPRDGVFPLDLTLIQRRWEIINNGVQELGHTDLAHRRAVEDRKELPFEGA